ncbi:maleate isomerase [Bradyrhizobium sp. S3.2.6]|uniref:Asp/Glu racemase n=1 Tax=Bradyrhizobium japonicum TaxID=375 RepID=A0A1Y2JRJ7_BRAJP|nr:hypothetical protein [Bradyrhizobium japonicum]OSJ34148.1 hypothetical protein BSZ19_13380 [Bradyrhizobium japonicum]
MHEQISTKIFERHTNPAKVVARIGLILLSTDEMGGDAFVSMMPKDKVSVFQTRIAYEYSGGGFSMPTSFRDVADTLPPAGRLDVLAFSCTSWTVAMGAEIVLSQLKEARTGIKYTSPAHAAVAALRQLKAKKIALLSPYELVLHRPLIPFFRENGFEITADGSFATSSGTENNSLRRESIFAAAKELTRHNLPDALLISCTAMPIVPHIDSLEREIGIPVVTSSQAMAWDALRLAGFRDPIDGFGRLLASGR